MEFNSAMGMLVMQGKASWNEFHLVVVGTLSFLLHISSISLEATVERLVLVQRAGHFPVALLHTDHTDQDSGFAVSHL